MIAVHSLARMYRPEKRLFALVEACGLDYSASVEKGLRWLSNPAEITGSLVDMERNVIWHKVAQRGPSRLVRGLQAAASGLQPAIRLPAVDLAFPPNSVDYESRPYHMGSILHAWPLNRTLEPLRQYSRLYKKLHFKA